MIIIDFKWWFLEIEVFGILIILWKCYSWTESGLFYVSELKRLDKFLISSDVAHWWTLPSEKKTTCNCYSRDHTTSFNLFDIFFLVYKVILYYCCCAAKTVNKQGYIHASCQVAEMAFLSIMSTYFFYRYFRWFEFSLCLTSQVIWRLTSKWLVKVDLVGDVEVILPDLSQYNLNRFFLAQI